MTDFATLLGERNISDCCRSSKNVEIWTAAQARPDSHRGEGSQVRLRRDFFRVSASRRR